MMRRETLFLDQDSQLFPHIETVIKSKRQILRLG